MKKCLKCVQLEFCFGGMRCRKINEAMLILCLIAVAEAGKPYRKDTPQIPHFFNQHDSRYRPPCKCQVRQKSRNSSVLTITKRKTIWK